MDKSKMPLANKFPHYWQSGRSAPDVWIVKTKRVLENLGATDISEAFGASADGRAAFMLAFKIGGDHFRIVWPVLPVDDPKHEAAARTQAATLLYHDCKARAISAAVLGPRVTFLHAVLLPGGKTLGEIATPELAASAKRVGINYEGNK